MPIKHIECLDEFNTIIKGSGNKLVVVDFTATWCGPCKGIAPYFEELSVLHPNVLFVKVDVDEASDVSEECGISCMPTFHFYKNGERLHEFSGANRNSLKKKVEELQ